MLSFLFGFNARIGRVHYLLGPVALAIFMAVTIFALVSSTMHSGPGPHVSAKDIMLSQLKWPLITLGAIFVVISFTLQSMRFRDIGWDPVCVIPGWFAILILDKLIATKFPAVSLGQEHHGTVVGALVNLALLLALAFWPGGSDAGSAPTFSPPGRPDALSRRQDSASLSSARTAGNFGRRTF